MSLEAKVSRREFIERGVKIGSGLLLVGNLSLLKGCAPNVSDGIIEQPHTIDDIINHPRVREGITTLANSGVPFLMNREETPPNIAGNYEIKLGTSPTFSYFNNDWFLTGSLGDGEFKILDQSPDNYLAISFSQSQPHGQIGNARQGMVRGKGNKFTIFSILDEVSVVDGKECKAKSALIMNGERKDNLDIWGDYLSVPIDTPDKEICNYVPTYSIYQFSRRLTADKVKGLDVSHYQNDKGPIDWSKVYNAGYKFAFVKATDDNGKDNWANKFEDRYFEVNMDNATSAGLLAGSYHYATPSTRVNASNSARFFINKAKNYILDGYLIPALDIELTRGLELDLDREKLTSWVHEWMEVVKDGTGVEPILYVSPNFARDNLNSSVNRYNLWVAHYTHASNPDTAWWNNWDFWQFSDKSNIPGIVGEVDEDVFNGTIDRLRTFLIH